MRLNCKHLLILLFLSMAVLAVIPSPALADTDGNDSFAEAVEIFAGSQNTTTMDFRSDLDYFKITVDQTCSISSTISHNGSFMYYQLYDSQQQSLQTRPVTYAGSVKASYKVSPGTYYIRISDYATSGTFTPYTVNFNVNAVAPDSLEQNDTPALAVQAKSGTQYNMSIEAVNDYEWFKIDVPQTSSIVCTTSRTAGNYVCSIFSSSDLTSPLWSKFNPSGKVGWKVGPGTYYVKLSEWDSGSINYENNNFALKITVVGQDSLEQNDTPAQAVQATSGTQYNMSIEAVNDYEWFKIDVPQTSSIVCTTSRTAGNYICGIYSSSDLTNPIKGKFNPSGKVGWKVSPGTYYVRLSEWDSGSINYENNSFSLTITLKAQDAHENNDTLASATRFNLGDIVSGVSIEAANDYDWFTFTANSAGPLNLQFTNSSNYLDFALYNSSGVQLDSRIMFSTYTRNIASGTYFIRLKEYSDINYLNSNISFSSATSISELEKTQLGKPGNSFACNDPVNPALGNFTLENTDLSIPARGLPLAVTRFYNSRSEAAGPLGKGWQFNWGGKLTANADSSVTVSYADGHEYRFPYSGGVYQSPDGCYETLVKNADNSYTLTLKNQSIYIYNSSGQLIQIKDISNNATNLAYTSGKLTSVTDSAGRSLTFTYNGTKIIKVTDPMNRQVQYGYDTNGNLNSVTDVNGKVTTYAYNSYGLTSVTDPNGHQTIANSYDAMGRVLSQTDGEGNVTRFQYDLANRKTTMMDAKGNSGSFTYDAAYHATRVDYPGGIYEEYTLDADGNRLTSRDKNGNITTCTYDGMGNMLTKTDPAPLNYVTTMTYNPGGHPLTIVDAAGYTTNFSYDSAGRLLTQSRAVNGQNVITTFSYSDYGQISSITDPNGNTKTFSYDQYGNISSKTDPQNNTASFTYDLAGRKLTETDPLNHSWTYSYDNAGHVLTATDPMNHVTTSVYDNEGQLVSVTDARSNTSTFSYDHNGKQSSMTDPAGRTTSYVYDDNGNLASMTEPGYATTSYSYDALDRLVSTSYPDSSSESLTLDGNGNVTAKTGRNGSTTGFSYDALNRLVQSTDPLNGIIQTEYDPLGNVVSVTDQRGQESTSIYDAASRMISSTDPGGHTTSFTYDLAGNRLTMTDPLNAVWSYSYDNNNRLLTSNDPLNAVQSMVYDAAGNMTSSTDANGNTSSYSYNANNQLVSVTNALNNTSSYSYDSNGNLITVTDGNGNITNYSYDSLNRITSSNNPLNQSISNSYDTAGNISNLTKADGNSVSYSYDSMHRLTGITASGQSQASFSYDSAGRRSSMTDNTGSTSYSYDSLNRINSVSKSGQNISYSYDPAGNLTNLSYPGSQSVSYSYDNENRLQSATENGNTSSFSYDAAGRKTQETLANGVIGSYQYDSKGRLTNISHVKDGITIASAAYTYDSTVNPLTMTSTEGQTSYQYDDIYQLTNVSYPDNSSESFTYDSAGNRSSYNGISYIYDTANRLLQAGTDVYTYDQNGNRITENAKQYQYDWNNRLTSITNGDETTQFTYDGDGSRTNQAKIVSGATIEASSYIYDPSQGIPRLLQEEIVSGPTLSYVYAGRLLEQTGSSTGTMFYHQDAIGNTMAMTDMTGAAVNTYRYKAFGASELISGTAPNNRQFTGHVSDSTGLIYMNARYYDPATGRFLTQDTVPGRPMDPLSYNLYAYCKNNPVAYTDPSGNWDVCVHGNYTYEWAIEAGFSPWQATIIAIGCINVDNNPDTAPVRFLEDGSLYVTDDTSLSWHFDRSHFYNAGGPTGEDTRITHMNSELDVFRENSANNQLDALFALGRALHARQDVDAHSTMGVWSPDINSPHNLPPEDIAEYGDPTDLVTYKPERFDATASISMEMLKSAHDNYSVGEVSYDEMSNFVQNDERVTMKDRVWVNNYVLNPGPATSGLIEGITNQLH